MLIPSKRKVIEKRKKVTQLDFLSFQTILKAGEAAFVKFYKKDVRHTFGQVLLHFVYLFF